MQTFKDFTLPSVMEKALAALGYEKPTPIQQQAIPHGLAGRDLIGCAQTGTGKTAAFCIPLMKRLLESEDEVALVLTPTRELAIQIDQFWRELTKFSPELRSAVIIGGTSMHNQLKALSRGPRVLIATPGRLCDHLNQRTVNLSGCRMLVLDEADRMLDMGFAPQLSRIHAKLPNDRQTLLFSATWETSVDKLAKKYLNNPERITIGTISKAASTIVQQVIEIGTQGKNDRLLDELNAREGTVLVFLRTQSRTDRVGKFLESYGIEAGRLHGGRSQAQRTSALNGFRSGKVRVLVATDLAARGIDVSQIQHVINFDLPMQAEDYVHRIGRTGRAGETGTAVSFVTPEDRSHWKVILRLLEKSGSPMPTRILAAGAAAPKASTKPARVFEAAKNAAAAPTVSAPMEGNIPQGENATPMEKRKTPQPARYSRPEGQERVVDPSRKKHVPFRRPGSSQADRPARREDKRPIQYQYRDDRNPSPFGEDRRPGAFRKPSFDRRSATFPAGKRPGAAPAPYRDNRDPRFYTDTRAPRDFGSEQKDFAREQGGSEFRSPRDNRFGGEKRFGAPRAKPAFGGSRPSFGGPRPAFGGPKPAYAGGGGGDRPFRGGRQGGERRFGGPRPAARRSERETQED